MPADHLPVLPEETVRLLAVQPGQVAVDATIGLGGHAVRLLEGVGPSGLLIGLDVDPGNLVLSRERLSAVGGNFRLFHANFAELPDVLDEAGLSGVDAILADLGVSSNQLEDPARGLSFQLDGPLDMRLDPRLTRTAADLVNSLGEHELADLLFELGGERHSRRIARAICHRRVGHRIATTGELSRIVCSALRVDPLSRKSRIHPATQTFLALRSAVNGESDNLDRLLAGAGELLNPGGRLAVISFHSLEDRRVKRAFAAGAASGIYQILTKKPIQPSADEIRANPRSRSAKLRAVARVR